MPKGSFSIKSTRSVLVGDACLFTAAAFCALVFAPQLALLVGPALAWYLHGRSFERVTLIGGLLGIVAGFVLVVAVSGLVALVSNAIGPVGGSEFAAPLALLGLLAAGLLVVFIALDVAAVRDLMADRRVNQRLDVARLVSTAVIIAFVAMAIYLQVTRPTSEYGEAGIFALASGVVGAASMMGVNFAHARMDKSDAVMSGTAGSA